MCYSERAGGGGVVDYDKFSYRKRKQNIITVSYQLPVFSTVQLLRRILLWSTANSDY